VISGQDVVNRIEQGDVILSVRIATVPRWRVPLRCRSAPAASSHYCWRSDFGLRPGLPEDLRDWQPTGTRDLSHLPAQQCDGGPARAGLALVFVAGAGFNPWLIGLARHRRRPGRDHGYLVGYSGRGAVENRQSYSRVGDGWSATGSGCLRDGRSANPVFDIAGITAGIMRIPVGLFLLAAVAGNVLKATAVALAGAGTAELISPLIRSWLGR